MRWTRLSFFYLVGYLTLGGLGLLFAPALALQLLGATGSYPAVLVRFMGSLLLALGILVAEIVRLRVEALYPTTLIVRVVLVATMVPLYVASRDPLFLVLTGIVGLGMVLTATGLLADRRARRVSYEPNTS
jgi:uncharacterized protein YjeT (DUF2065 family)